jgi:hypothetical protein
MVDNIDNYKDRISEIFQLDEESFEYYNLMKKAIYLSEWLNICVNILYKIIENKSLEKVKKYLDYLEKTHIRWFYLKNLIRICRWDLNSLINYIEKEINFEVALNSINWKKTELIPSYLEIMLSLRKISTKDEFESYENYLRRKNIEEEKIELYFFILDFTSIREMKVFLDDEIDLRKKIYWIK